MDSTIAAIISLISIIGLVIYLSVLQEKAQFEINEHHREMFKLFFDGFAAGLETENTNNRIYVDDILKRVGFTAPEQTTMGTIQEVVEQRLVDVEDMPLVTLAHEADFDLEQMNLQEERNTAQWLDRNLPNYSQMNTLSLYDQENPPT